MAYESWSVPQRPILSDEEIDQWPPPGWELASNPEYAFMILPEWVPGGSLARIPASRSEVIYHERHRRNAALSAFDPAI